MLFHFAKNAGLGFAIRFDKSSQKAKSIRKCDKVSLTIDRDYGGFGRTDRLEV